MKPEGTPLIVRCGPGTDGEDSGGLLAEGARVAPGGGPGSFRRGGRGGADVRAVGVAFVMGRTVWVWVVYLGFLRFGISIWG